MPAQVLSGPVLEVNRVSKAFAAPVLKTVDLSVAAGEVVALTGENGAGKSTLAKIIAGLTAPDSGLMQLGGKRYAPGNRAAAERAGVRMVLQELGLIGTLSIAENLLLGQIPATFGFIRRDEMERIARTQLARVGLFEIDPERPVSDLGIGQQQLVEIARGLMGEARLLVLDEPTAMLTAREIGHLFAQIEQLKARGVAVIYISHRLDELSRVADRVVVLRDGELIVSRPAREATHEELVQAMIGHAPTQSPRSRASNREPPSLVEKARTLGGTEPSFADEPRPSGRVEPTFGEAPRSPGREASSLAVELRAPGREVLRIAGFSRRGRVRDVSLKLHAGEILGLAGLVGAGRTELLRMIFGADRKDAGTIYLDGTLEPVRIRSPMRAVARGIGLLTEDRKTQGLLLGQSVAANLTIANLGEVSPLGLLSPAREKSVVEHWTQRLRIRARDRAQAVDELSGGNQQKVLLARWLHRDCRVLLLDEPTRGIDVGARADIYAVLDSLAAQGKALLVVSSDLRELMEICDRIAVMSNGALVRTFERGQWSEQALLAAAFSAFGGAPNGAANSPVNTGPMRPV